MANKNWIIITGKKKNKKIPSSIRITTDGKVYIDAKPFNDNNPEYRNFSVSVENNTEMNMGEETKRLLELQKTSHPGERVIAKNISDGNRKEQTTVKF